MKLWARQVDVPPDPRRVARALAGEPGLAFLWSGRGASYVACRPLASTTDLDPEPSLALDPDAGPLAAVPRFIGLLPYECRRSLERPRSSLGTDLRAAPHVTEPLWLRYGAVARVAEDVLVVGDDRAAVEDLARLIRRAPRTHDVHIEATGPREPDAVHRARIERALELILEGEIYQVNLARRFDFRVVGSAVDLLERFARRARGPHGVALEVDGLTVASSSPELFLELRKDGGIVTGPVKGTRPRGHDAVEDRALASALDADPKERAELAMVIDVERNDFGRVARTGSVRVTEPRVETHGAVHHRAARISARLRPGVSRTELFEATLPSGSVTGAPKIRAMEVIRSLEAERRGLYTGAFGALAHDGALGLGMAIRILTARDGVGHYFAGGGIVADSDPGRELEETRWKAVQVLELLGEAG